MAQRVAETVMRVRRFGPKYRFRVDLHGVSMFGPKEQRTALRWEWITGVAVEPDGVLVTSERGEFTIPAGAFGKDPAAMARLLEGARSIEHRTTIIGELNG